MIRLVRVAHAVGTATRLAGLGLLVPMVASLLLDPWDRRVLGSFELPGTFLAFGLCAALGLSLWLPLRVLSRDAAEWFQKNPERIPLTREPFIFHPPAKP